MEMNIKNAGCKKIFLDVRDGEVFKSGDSLYIRADVGLRNYYNAVNLETGLATTFQPHSDVVVPTRAVCEIEW